MKVVFGKNVLLLAVNRTTFERGDCDEVRAFETRLCGYCVFVNCVVGFWKLSNIIVLILFKLCGFIKRRIFTWKM
jgi:hypothetical protein